MWGDLIPSNDALFRGFGEFEGYPVGQYTDDTQLTIATVEAILEAGDLDCSAIASRIARLWANQAVVGPGGACTRAAHAFLEGADWRSCGAPVGQAGNGTAMRMAVIGLTCLDDPERLPALAADVARITHHDPRSIAGGVGVAKAAQLLADGGEPDAALCADVARAMEPYEPEFAQLVHELPPRLAEPEDEALHRIAWAGQRRAELERPIITPFVVPTVLACLFSILRHPSSWTEAVGHVLHMGGDVDTTGSITGALMGTKLGLAAIPADLSGAVLDAERLRMLGARLHAWVTSRSGTGGHQ